MSPCSYSFCSSLFLLSFKSSRFFPGCMDAGALGSTARVADSAHESSAAGLPKYLHAAASSPTTLPPNGAWAAYRASIFFLEYRSSSLVACTASMAFCQMVRSFPRESLITCMVMVEPPLTVCPWLRLSLMARPIASGSTPGCHRKRLSSNWIRAVAKRSGTVSDGGKRHCPSSAILAPRSSPSALSTTVE